MRYRQEPENVVDPYLPGGVLSRHDDHRQLLDGRVDDD